MRKIPPGVLVLLIANGLMFLAFMLADAPPPRLPGQPPQYDAMTKEFALFFPGNPHFAPWQFVTHMFMHGGPAHIFFNMFALFSFGSLLEQLWGTRRFVTFFLICGLGAGLIQTAANEIEYQHLSGQLEDAGMTERQVEAMLKTMRPPLAASTPETEPVTIDLFQLYYGPMVGASGAVYGVLVAFGLMFPNAKLMLLFLPVPVAAKYFIPGILLLDIAGAISGSFSIFGAQIAHFAHLGGALIGFLLMWYWRQKLRAAARARHPFATGPDEPG